MLQPVAGKIKFQNYAVVDKAVNGCRRGHGVLEDVLPLGKGQITGYHQRPPLVALSQEDKKNLHLLPVLLNIADVVANDQLVL